MAKIGDKVVLPNGQIAEILEFSKDIKGLITRVKIMRENGSYYEKEVADLVVDAVLVLREVFLSDVVKTFAHWFNQLFKRKRK
jgi:hypothetical protein